MIRPLLPLLLSALAFVSPALACFNDYVPNVAAIERSKSVLDQLKKHVVTEPWDARRDRLRKELAAGGDYKVKNDLATSLAHTGEAAEAVTLLEQIEAEKPGLYVTAANLGTAYELAGNNEKALEWIRKGIERNPNAHERTEWLHVKILEAKLAMKADPTWLRFHSVLGPRKSEDEVEITVTGNRGEALSVAQVKAALIYQLHERLQFVKPPDAIVGDLLVNLGDLLQKEPTGLGGAKDVFDLGATYLDGINGLESLQTHASGNAIGGMIRQRYGHAKDHTSILLRLAATGLILAVLIIGLKRMIVRLWSRKKAEVDRVSPPISG